MNKIKFFLIGVVVLVLVLIIYLALQQEYEPSLKDISLPDDQNACEEMEGVWVSTPFSGKMYCDKFTGDAGKKCSDSDECETYCLTSFSKEILNEIEAKGFVEGTGECSDRVRIFGCHAFVEDGRVAYTFCAD